jgi:hypothetical protein
MRSGAAGGILRPGQNIRKVAIDAGGAVAYAARGMTRCFPRVRGWIAFLAALLASVFYSALLPPRYSTLGDWRYREPVSPAARIIGVILIVGCVAACVEAFRRGTRADRIAACIGACFTFCLVYEFLKSFFYGVGY